MKKIVLIFMLTLGFAWNCHAQTWAYVQDSILTYCTANSTSCTVGAGNVIPTTPGTVRAVFISTPTNVTISSVTDNGGNTWNLCPASSCHVFGSINNDLAYSLGGGSITSVTINLSGSSGAFWGGNFYEIMPPSGSVPSFDTAGAVSRSSCSGPCTAVGLTLSATDAVLQILNGNGVAAWNSFSSPYFLSTNGDGFSLNTTSGTAPTVTIRTPANGGAFTAIAFKSSLGTFTPATATMSLVNYAMSGQTGVNCQPSCTLSIPSPAIGSGHLLYVEAATLGGTHITSISGGGTWVVPSGCQITLGGSDALSCAYVLSSTPGATSITVTMSGNSSVGLAFSEVASSGTFAFDVIGSAQNSASLSPAGVPLTLTGNNDAIFQSSFVPGGTSGVTFYPFSYADHMGMQILNANAAQATLLNASTGVVPRWANEQNNATVVTGIAFKTGTAVAVAPPTGLAAVVH